MGFSQRRNLPREEWNELVLIWLEELKLEECSCSLYGVGHVKGRETCVRETMGSQQEEDNVGML